MFNPQNIHRNLKAVENAIAQQRLEGLKVPTEVIEDLRRAARGEIAIEEGIRTIYAKFAHAEVRRPRPLS